jgi:hypothetical protein
VRFLFADATGIFCFFVEHYCSMHGRFKSKSVDFLLLRQTAPHKIVAQLYWKLTGGVYKITMVIFGVRLLFDFHWELLLFLVCCAHGTGMHRWFHQIKKKTTLLVGNLQGFKSIQNKEYQHNTSTFNKNDCVITNNMHPIFTSHLFLGVCS